MYKFTVTTSKDIFGEKLDNWYHFHAIGDKQDIIIASIKDIPCNEDFLIWLEAAARLEAERKPHLIADQVAELIKLFQEYEEKRQKRALVSIYRKICRNNGVKLNIQPRKQMLTCS